VAATWDPTQRSWHVTLWSSQATSASVIVVDRERPGEAVALVMMQRDDDDVWHATITASTVGDADLYGLRVDGPPGPTSRFDRSKLLLDPEATEVWFPPDHDRDGARVPGNDTLGRSPFGVLPMSNRRTLVARGPRHALDDLVIYEVHVRGATMRCPAVSTDLRGRFAGLAALAPYLESLGVTAVELLPVHQFDPEEGNYWGYMPLAWSALHHGYASDAAAADDEFRAMVQVLHDHDIEVLLDVVYNHTTEEDEEGPTYHLRAIDDAAYYVLHPDGTYRDDAGCGNVVRAAEPAAGRMILASLERLADLGVDGFRFDLGSLLGRDRDGRVQEQSPFIEAITAFASARDVRLIAEPWDLSAYQVGDAFPGRTWAQWNGRFRDDCRSFLRAEDGAASAFARRVLGSPDLYPSAPERSINFVTAHDGFTLYDLVSYERKHNDANGHGSMDGTDDNRSWNCGWEGDDMPLDEPGVDPVAIRRLRVQQMQNAFVLLLLADGVPMLVAGDEFAQTQGGNNNPYNQDNETTWLDWSREDTFREVRDCVRELVALRRTAGRLDGAAVTLHGVDETPDLGYTSHSLAWQRGDLYVIANAWWEPLAFPVHADGDWTIALATADPRLEAPSPGGATSRSIVHVPPRSTVVLRRSPAANPVHEPTSAGS
jgi:isoamylase